MNRQSNQITALYCRIANYTPGAYDLAKKQQMETLSQYAEDHHLENPQFYCDWGVSGTSMNRPEYRRMIQDILERKVSTLVVLNLSRLNRDSTACWELIGTVLRQRGIAFHSIQDGDGVAESLKKFAQIKSELLEAYRQSCKGGQK